MRKSLVTLLTAAALTGLQPGVAQAADPCVEDLLGAGIGKQSPRPITTHDLVRLRDFGRSDSYWAGEPSFGISPDRRSVALLLRRADPASNSYCQGLVVVDLSGDLPPKIIDIGREIAFDALNLRGSRLTSGVPLVQPPQWTADGKSVLLLKAQAGVTQLWLANREQSSAAQLTTSDDPVEKFTISPDGLVIYGVNESLRKGRDEIARVGKSGHLYGPDFRPVAGDVPELPWDDTLAYKALDLDRMSSREATAADIRLLDSRVDVATRSVRFASSGASRAWTERLNPGFFIPETKLVVEVSNRSPVACGDKACTNVEGLWWNSAGSELRFLKREGWAKNEMAIYRLKPGNAKPQLVLKTRDVLITCQALGDDLICAREGSSRPKDLVRVDMRTGNISEIFDPNPEFAYFTLGKVERLFWRNNQGFECYGDLVLPPDYRAGSKLPLVITQYDTRGFLRGGTGDEYPIHVLAARGYAVLSLQRVKDFGVSPTLKSIEELHKLNQAGWADRRSVQSSIEEAIKLLDRRGLVDMRRIGITGLSDGTSSVQFALINSNLFRAAIMSSCCEEAYSQSIIPGIATAREYEAQGRPTVTGDVIEFWKPFSLAINAARIRTPLLMNLPSSEYRSALASYTFLKAYNQPVEMFVFPDERHIKWQPAHRLAIYDRVIDWFDFWMLGKEDDVPDKRSQYIRWKALASPSSPRPLILSRHP